jgi:hypothetical protein
MGYGTHLRLTIIVASDLPSEIGKIRGNSMRCVGGVGSEEPSESAHIPILRIEPFSLILRVQDDRHAIMDIARHSAPWHRVPFPDFMRFRRLMASSASPTTSTTRMAAGGART